MTGRRRAPSSPLALAGVALTGLFAASAASADPAPIAWLHDEARAVEQARASGKPLVIDFRADWCGACKMLDAYTWSDPEVRAEVAARFVPLQLDLTNEEDEATHRLAERYGVSGLPTILAGDRRVVGFVRAREMVTVLRAAEK
ncbi:MAG TPA: thioredoxin family protein [Myxococcales bacterium]|nr:thioredoxin family protein [Myxococcales bacterium]